MKASELRRNNLVYRFEEGVGFGIVKVTSSEIEELECIEEDADLWNDGFYLTEIPLTEEWLLRFGFKETEKQTYEITDFKDCIDFCVSIYEDKVILTFWSYDHIYFRYSEMNVHQLQNLYFALTGEELTLSE